MSLQAQLTDLAAPGIDLWLTEVTANATDMNENSGVYNDLLRMAFSFPEVKGIILWIAYGPGTSNPNAAIWEGTNLTVLY